MRKTKIKTIDITVKEWFDKVNGNSYFAGTVTINFGTKSVREYKLPYQYGYGDHYIEMAKQTLKESNESDADSFTQLWSHCRYNNIILRTVKHKNCKKSELSE